MTSPRSAIIIGVRPCSGYPGTVRDRGGRPPAEILADLRQLPGGLAACGEPISRSEEGSMRWDELPGSDNVEDRRGEDGFGGGFGLAIGGGGLGIGTIVVLGLIGWALGIDPRLLIGGAEILSGGGSHVQQPMQPSGGQARRTGKPSDDIGRFVSTILGNLDREWTDVFQRDGKTYRKPVLVLYQGQTSAACGGVAQSAMGPFYCPEDQKVYLDTSFFREIETRFRGCEGKACEFSQAYVIAHEVGHHVQNQ